MPIKTPDFWYRPYNSMPTALERIITPLSSLYLLAHNINMGSKTTKHAPIPVICLGNITAGGSGKTPSIIALNALIKNHNIFNSPYFLSRGYGSKQSAAKSITGQEPVNEAGDEPLLLAKHSNTVISVNRYDGAIFAYDMGADLVLMDDGFQNPSLHKDLSFIVIDGKTGLGNRKIIPAGPLREPVIEAFKRCDAVILIGEDKTNIAPLIPSHTPIFAAKITAIKLNDFDLTAKYIGFAGLGHPQKFYDTLQKNKFDVIEFHNFADHHPYSDNEINILLNKAMKNNAKLITTEKDYVRIPQKYRDNISFLPIELKFDNEQKILSFLKDKLISSKST